MELKGQLVTLTEDLETKKVLATFEINNKDVLEYRGKQLLLTVKPYRRKRSKNANALLWECIDSIALSLQTDKWKVYLNLLKRYGKFTYLLVLPEAVEAVKATWRETEIVGEVFSNGKKMIELLCYFGSSTYNTQEFSRLLEGTFSEMREMGISVPTDQDLLVALQRWEKETQTEAKEDFLRWN